MSDIGLSTGLHTRLEQRLRLAPQIIQSIEILQLPTLALEELIHQEMTDNPVLEILPPQPAEETPEESPAEEPADEPEAQRDDEGGAEPETGGDWRELFGGRPTRQGAEASDRKQEAMLNTAARPATLQESLLAQFRLLDASQAVSVAATDIIYNLDDAGYLHYPLSELAAGSIGRYTLAEAEEALRLVQTLEPAGMGARDLRECLLLQIPPEQDDLAREIIERHLTDVEQNRLPKIVHRTGRSLEEVKEAVERISRLNPRPGASFGGVTAPGIVPDVIVDYTDKGYETRLADDHVPNLFISKLYEELASSPDAPEQTKKYLREKIRAARWLIDAIEQRRTTLFRISRAIVDMQTEFLDFGLSRLRPLRMQEVADKVAVHVSTVSRAIADKYIQTPRGIFPIKYFFTGGVSTDSGEMQTWRTIQQEIRDVVDKEDKSNPLSDEEIAEVLSRKGSHVARRTVTKYRKALAIASSRRRRAY